MMTDRLQLILDKAHEIALKEVQSPREPGFAKIKAAAIEMAKWCEAQFLPCEYIAQEINGRLVDRQHSSTCRKCEALAKIGGASE